MLAARARVTSAAFALRPPELTPDEIAPRLAALPGWRLEQGALRRELRFEGFDAAFAFMTRVAAAARALDHHPDWSNSYGRVQIALCTHDVGGLTHLDFDLARAIDAALVG